MKPVLALSLALALASCAPARHHLIAPEVPPLDPFEDPPYGLGLVCVLRPHTVGGALLYLVRDNGRLVGATRQPSYFCYLAQPGAHRIEVHGGGGQTALELLVEAGGRRYVHHRLRPGRRDELTAMPRERAAALLERCDYRVLVEAPEPIAEGPMPAR
jgi:hypothetical protein